MIPDGVTGIDFDAFAGCIGLAALSIPASVTRIGEGAFDGCGALADIRYRGSEAQWQGIRIDGGNEALLGAKLSFEE